MLELILPFPPTVNNYYRTVHGRMLISARGRKYRKAVLDACVLQRATRQEGTLGFAAEAFPPDRRRRDLDNLFKGLLDALQHAGVVEDDSQFASLSICWGAGYENLVRVRIWRIP